VYRIKCYIIVSLITCFGIAGAQSTVTDARQNAEELIKSFWESRGVNSYKSDSIADEILRLANKISTDEIYSKAYHVKGLALLSFGKFDHAFAYLDSSLTRALTVGDTSLISTSLNSLGSLSTNQSNYNDALNYFIRSQQFIKPGDTTALASNYNNIAMVHEAIGDNGKALEYFEKALQLHRQTANKKAIGGTLVNIGIIYYNLKEYNKAQANLTEAIEIMEQLGDNLILSIASESMGNVYRAQALYSMALASYNKSLQLSKILNDLYGLASVELNIGETYLMQKQYQVSITHLMRAEEYARTTGSKSIVMNSQRLLAKAFAADGNYARAYFYLGEYQVLKDSLFNETKNKQLQELQAKYESDKKDREIVLLNTESELQKSELRTERVIRNASVVGVLLILIAGIAVVRNYRMKISTAREMARKSDEINRQQVLQLHQEKKIAVLDAMISGEEKERKRLASEIHDGLSGMIAAIKMQFENLRTGGNNLSKEYDAALEALDTTSLEVRRIAHNLMPHILIKYGLIEALTEYINNVRTSSRLNIVFTHAGFANRLSPQIELSLYRSIQELVNNIVKHAKATEVLLQLNFTNGLIMATLEDNGIGIEMEKIKEGKGIGLSNIKSRIEYVGGRFAIHSEKGKGTSVNIELDVI